MLEFTVEFEKLIWNYILRKTGSLDIEIAQGKRKSRLPIDKGFFEGFPVKNSGDLSLIFEHFQRSLRHRLFSSGLEARNILRGYIELQIPISVHGEQWLKKQFKVQLRISPDRRVMSYIYIGTRRHANHKDAKVETSPVSDVGIFSSEDNDDDNEQVRTPKNSSRSDKSWNLTKNRAKYSVKEDERIWKYLLRKVEANPSLRNQIRGTKIWEDYVKESGSRRTPALLSQHFRRQMVVKLWERPSSKNVQTIEKQYRILGIPMSTNIREKIGRKFENVKIILDEANEKEPDKQEDDGEEQDEGIIDIDEEEDVMSDSVSDPLPATFPLSGQEIKIEETESVVMEYLEQIKGKEIDEDECLDANVEVAQIDTSVFMECVRKLAEKKSVDLLQFPSLLRKIAQDQKKIIEKKGKNDYGLLVAVLGFIDDYFLDGQPKSKDETVAMKTYAKSAQKFL
ncbi:unnamed protein product [Caenorhabditis auriculariae]|uniref:SPK domain-containing protein n=1 Tax=Caenorhabditis auriculariae TaxID=2777116 RepID=A0A8S1GSK0_9PELO|nr:unnamed protein product [Caenorhabditis auriculariae]